MAALKYSRQRQEIKRHLISRMDHPTAEMIYTSLKEDDPRLSLGTVYRNLSLLTQTGEIRRLQTGDGPDHFDAKTVPHQHFICRGCGCIVDLYPEGLEKVITAAASGGDVEVEQIVMTVYGLCGKCKKEPQLRSK